MKELINLINEYGAFKEQFPKGGLSQFCRYYLAHNEASVLPEPGDKIGPKDLDSRFMRAITRTTLSFWTYLRIALKETQLKTIEQFTLLASLLVQGELRKSDVINYAMIEQSTGIEMLNRLVKSGYINERIDPQDKRVRLLSITPKGKKEIQACFKKSQFARDILLDGVRKEDKEICTIILEPLHERHSVNAIENKAKKIEDIYEALLHK